VESQVLWKLVVQKVRGFRESILPSEDHRVELFRLLRGILLDGDKDGKAESVPDYFDTEMKLVSRAMKSYVSEGNMVRDEENVASSS
jgi:hypothetical protein